MTVVEFIGGPLDGKIVDMPNVPPVWYVCLPPPRIMAYDVPGLPEFVEPRRLAYNRRRFFGGSKDGMVCYTVEPHLVQ